MIKGWSLSGSGKGSTLFFKIVNLHILLRPFGQQRREDTMCFGGGRVAIVSTGLAVAHNFALHARTRQCTKGVRYRVDLRFPPHLMVRFVPPFAIM